MNILTRTNAFLTNRVYDITRLASQHPRKTMLAMTAATVAELVARKFGLDLEGHTSTDPQAFKLAADNQIATFTQECLAKGWTPTTAGDGAVYGAIYPDGSTGSLSHQAIGVCSDPSSLEDRAALLKSLEKSLKEDLGTSALAALADGAVDYRNLTD